MNPLKPKDIFPDLKSEVSLGFFSSRALIIGVDEVGRGCFAGPVVAGAVALRSDIFLQNPKLYSQDGARCESLEVFRERPVLFKSRGDFNLEALASMSELLLWVQDSKLLKEPFRDALAPKLIPFIEYEIAESSVQEIEDLNILKASQLAMERAVEALEMKLGRKADHILIDGNLVPSGLKGRGIPIVKGDQKSLSISCAALMAKVSRDAQMNRFDEIYPGFGMKDHKGYGTPFHRKRIIENGITPIHRKTFRGVKEYI